MGKFAVFLKSQQEAVQTLQTALHDERVAAANTLVDAQLKAQDWKNQFDGSQREIATQLDQITTLRLKNEQLERQLHQQAQTIWEDDERRAEAYNKGWKAGEKSATKVQTQRDEHGFEIPVEYLVTLETLQDRLRMAERTASSLSAAITLLKEQNKSLIVRNKTMGERNKNQAEIIAEVQAAVRF